MKIVFATGNPHKLKELREIAKDADIEFVLPPSEFNPIENGKTFEENSLIKAREAAKVSKMISLADDSGLCVDILNGEPGIQSARYDTTPEKRIQKLLKVLQKEENRKAKFVCSMTLVSKDGKILYQTKGEVFGKITKDIKGKNGFGYDPIFEVDGFGMTMAEISEEDKNKISHRALALNKMLEFIKNLPEN